MTELMDKIKAFEQAVLAGDYTSQQVSDATKAQLATMTGLQESDITDNLEARLKERAVHKFKIKADNDRLAAIRSQLVDGGRVWLLNNFPEAEFQITGNGRIINIHLDGLSEDK